ncbi:MAG TPA: MFS transporter [Candidatus Lokiarchaeia archaeon]|nr:MFS transporter [Candidatus Lokiarchaeia archaeon]
MTEQGPAENLPETSPNQIWSDAADRSFSDRDAMLKRRTMTISIVEGGFGVGSNSVSDNFLVPFALAIQSTPAQIGLLTSIPGIVNPVGQVLGSNIMYTRSRRGIIINGILGILLTWVILAALALAVEWSNALWQPVSWFLMLQYGLYNFFGGSMSPAWVSNMGDVVPADYRGRYFGKRNLITTATSMVIALVLSIWLQYFDDKGVLLVGFIVLFTISLGCRAVSYTLFHYHYFPPFAISKENHVSLRKFMYDLPRTNFGYFTLLVMSITLGQWIGGSFFNVYMLTPVSGGGLGFDYVTYVLMGVVNSLIALIVFPIVGKIGDKYGNVLLMRLGAIIVPTLPIMWVFTNTALSVALGPQVWGGIGWTAFNLATSNFIYDSVPSQKRGAYAAYYTLVVGIGQTAGGFLGSAIITLFPPSMLGSFAFQLLFLLSGVVRAIFVVIYLPKIKEINQKAKPLVNMKVGSAYKHLHDILLRDNTKKNGNNHHDVSGNNDTDEHVTEPSA